MTPQDTIWTRTARVAFCTDGKLTHRVEVAVIGAGFTGLTAARELTLSGRSVAVFDAGPLGAGASGMNAGFVVPNFAKADPTTVRARLGGRADALLRLIGAGACNVFDTIAKEGITCDAAQTGWLNPAHGAAAAEMLRARARLWSDMGRPVRFLSPGETAEQTGMDIYSGALLDEEGGTIHPLDYLRGLARAVQRRGGTVHEGQPVQRIEKAASGWTLHLPDGMVQAGTVLLCTNAFTDGAASRLGRSAVPLRVYQLATAPLDAKTVARIAPDRRPVGDTRQNLFTYRLDRNNRLVSGGMAAVPLGAKARLGRAVVERLAHELRLPFVPEVEVVWTGTAAMTPDFLPRIHQLGDGFFAGIGCNGRGIAMTAQLGGVLARAAMGEDPAALPVPLRKLRPLPFHRFTPVVASLALVQARLKDRFAA
ncbi:NAD(P)/FAD-dependent oxidoreductase [Falsirhodobacter sp. 1013]|uniref:NAD(P)/FAD-dependent oxidoreductase n=1 Tax=Falsirhodobacter sp. 1013 TaxID=3417566 RepID=UPI003EBABC2E